MWSNFQKATNDKYFPKDEEKRKTAIFPGPEEDLF